MWQLLNIVLASLIGVAVGALWSRNILALILGPVMIALAEAALIFAARTLSTRSPAAVWGELSHPALLAPVVLAAVSGAALSAYMLVRLGRSSSPQVWLPGDKGHKRPPNWRVEHWLESGAAPAPQRPKPGDGPVMSPPKPPSEAPRPIAPLSVPTPSVPPAPPRANRRRSPRRRTVLAGIIVTDSGGSIACTIRDLGVTGAQVQIADRLPPSGEITLIDRTNGIAHQARVAWRSGNNLGLRFARSVDLRNPATDQDRYLAGLWRTAN